MPRLDGYKQRVMSPADSPNPSDAAEWALPNRTGLWSSLLWGQPSERPFPRRLAASVGLTLFSFACQWLLAPWGGYLAVFFCSLAVVLSALYGGFKAGVLSAVLAFVLQFAWASSLVGGLAPRADWPPRWIGLTGSHWSSLLFLLIHLVLVTSVWTVQKERRRLHAALAQAQLNHRRFTDTFELAASGITHVDLDGTLLRCNRAFCALVGFTNEELRHMTFRDLTHPDDVAQDQALLEETLAGGRNGYTLEKRYLLRGQKTVWVKLSVALVRNDLGMPSYFISVVQDISQAKATEDALRTSEQLMKQAQSLAHMACWESTPEKGTVRAIGDAYRTIGIPASEFSIDDFMALIHPDDVDHFHQAMVSALPSAAGYTVAYRCVNEGQERWLNVSAEFERNAEGRVVRAFGVGQDITTFKHQELEIKRLNASLEQRIQAGTRELKAAYDELESYSYAVAHDLRSPLRIINGFSQALLEDACGLGDEGEDHLRRIMAASTRMGELIDGLLKLAQYGRSELKRQPVNLSEVAESLLQELAAGDPDHQVDWAVEPDVSVLADRALVQALMQNLLHNAWKYGAQTAQPQIRVTTEWRDDQRWFCVKDNGAGFDMVRAAKLFQPFQRLHKPHEFSGLGIGLATVRRIVERHGGAISAMGQPGHGAVFRFTLEPARSPSARPRPTTALQAVPSTSDADPTPAG